LNVETSKILGGIGAIMMFIGLMPVINTYGVIAFIGLILVMVALYNLASYYSEGGIFNNALYGLITGVVGGVAAGGIVVLTVMTSLREFLLSIFPSWNGEDWLAIQGLTPDPTNVTVEAIVPFLAGFFMALLIIWVFGIITAFFVRRSLTSLSAKSGVGLFSTAGLLVLIGAALIIALGIGFLLIWIGVLILAIAFFQLKPQQNQPTMSTETTS
jgi:uncharacterized membrane protein